MNYDESALISQDASFLSSSSLEPGSKEGGVLREEDELRELMKDGGGGLVTLALKGMPYAEYLLTNHWQSVRTAALQRANYRCQLDLAHKGGLDVHHLRYDNKGEEPPEDVIVLCRDCHKRWHETHWLQAREHMRRTLA